MSNEIAIIFSVIALVCLIVLWILIRMGFVNEVNKILLYFVTQAEREFGGKTGKLKKAAVLAWIYERMPSMARLFISSNYFGILIDAAVEEMKKYLESNTQAADIVKDDKILVTAADGDKWRVY